MASFIDNDLHLRLARVPDNAKAEIVNGEIILIPPSGAKSGRAACQILLYLLRHEDVCSDGIAFGGNVGFLVTLPNRGSFCPDAAWYVGPHAEGLGFVPQAPTFAVEIRGLVDYGPKAERAIFRKIEDYFAAGTTVVWDIDLLGSDTVQVYRAGTVGVAATYRWGEIAEAEPAVPGWRMPVDKLFK